MTTVLLSTILQWAIVTASAVYMQEAPDYESANVSQTSMGRVVEVLDHDRYWTRIRTPEPYEGWVNSLCLSETDLKGKDAWIESPRYVCTVEYTHIFSSPSDKSAPVTVLLMGDIVKKGGSAAAGWSEVILPSGRRGWVKNAEVKDFGLWARQCCPAGGPKASGLAAVAGRFLGAAYVWGGMSVKGFDCSGLVGLSYFMNGVLLPRDASDQVRCGEEVPVGEMQPGDLVFFGEGKVSHVALCIAPGRIIHSSQVVRINSLDPGAPDYYGRHIMAVRRILGHIDDGTGAVSIIRSPLYFKQ
ncbi:MAG: NlpC/P60 family protein [Bacteroidales bacterium]|nr:NlpC/P60 family protein [Bacteroidales bacterium]